MKPLKDQPIARKALVLGVAPAICALLMVAIASTTGTYFRARTTTVQDIETEAAILSRNMSRSLALGDRQTASDMLSAYRSKGNIEAVCVFDAAGNLFADFWQRSDVCPERVEMRPVSSRALFREHQVFAKDRIIGTVRVSGNLTRLTAWLQVQATVLIGTLVLALLFATALTRRLSRSIVRPIQQLASVADQVSTSADYRVRAMRLTDDEVGRLVDSFNGMLAQIQQHSDDAATLLKREQEANKLKDQFLAAVSHELRTPLNAILGWLHLIKTTNLDAASTDHAIERLERNALSQARVIDDLLDISRIVAGRLQLRSEVVDLRAALEGALDVVKPAFAARYLQLTVDVPTTPALVNGDAGRFQQIFWNLLSNASKFTPVNRSVSVQLAASGTEILLTVGDTGIGIAPEFLPHVFDRFRQADGSMTREHGGLGLGLAIAKELTELQGGTLSAASPGAGKGATFTMRVPQLVVKHAEAS